jgi:prepilin-type N-terminal cleavage/methylation domain-containing protein
MNTIDIGLIVNVNWKGNYMSDYHKKQHGQAGFTLVELSIVIVIIGFLISGIVAANSMIRQAELRSVMSDFRTYATAYNNFIGKYNAVPGDWNAASSIWSAECSGAQCNGNNNGLIEYINNPTTNEVNKAFRVLGLSGFVNGNYVYNAFPGNGALGTVSVVGITCPASKIDGAGYVMTSNAGDPMFAPPARPLNFAANKNFLLLGRENGTVSGRILATGALNAADAHNLDSKIDDGSINAAGAFVGARTGILMATTSPNAFTNNDCVNSTTDAYNTAESSSACMIGFALN